MAYASELREGSPPEKVPYRGKIGPYLVKKEFDEEGKAKFAAVELDIDISNISFLHNSSTIDYQLKFLDGTTENGQIFGKGSADFLYAGPKTITEVYISSNLTEPVINYGVFSDDGNGLQTIAAGERCVIQLAGDAAQFSSGMDAPNEWGQFAVAISQEENGVEGIQAYHFGARMYDPEVGQWLNVDPRHEFFHSYSYVGSQVMLRVDPNGMSSALWKAFSSVLDSKAGKWVLFGAGLLGLDGGTTIAAIATAHTTGQAIADVGYVVRTINDVADAVNAGGGFEEGLSAALCSSADYWLMGGNVQEGLGHGIGLTNRVLAGGDMNLDHYDDGVVVYSGGFLDKAFEATETGGAEYFGSAIYVHSNADEGVILHERKHYYQMRTSGGRFGYFGTYLSRNGWSLGVNDDYYGNEYEIEAKFYQWAYGEEYVDKNGNWRRPVDASMVGEFRNLYGAIYTIPQGWRPQIGL